MPRTILYYNKGDQRYSATTGKPLTGTESKNVTYTLVAQPEEFKKKKYAPKVTLDSDEKKHFSDVKTVRMLASLSSDHPKEYNKLNEMMHSKGAKYLSYSYKKHAFILYKSRPVKLGVFPLPAELRKTRPGKAG